MANGKIPLGDLPVKTPGNFDYLAGSQLGDAYRFPVPEVTNAARLLSESLGQVVADAEADIAPVIAGLGYLPPVPYASGLNVNSTRFTVIRDGQVYAPAAPVPFTTGAWNAGQWRLIQGIAGVDLSAPTGAEMVGFKQAGNSAIPRNANSKLREQVSVLDFLYPEDGANIAPALGRALAESPHVVFPYRPEGYRIESNLLHTVTADLTIDFQGQEVVFDNSHVSFTAGVVASSLALTSDVPRYATEIYLSSTASIAEGDLVFINTAVAAESDWGYTKKDCVKVKSVLGSIVELEEPLMFAYAAADEGLSVTVYRPARVSVIRPKFRMIGSMSGQAMMAFTGLHELDFQRPIGVGADSGFDPSANTSRRMFQLNRCWGVDVTSSSFAHLSYPILIVGGTRNVEVSGIKLRHCRHSIEPADWVKGITVRGLQASDCFQSVSSHPCFDVRFDGVQVERDSSLSNLRCVGASLRNAKIHTLADNDANGPYYHRVATTAAAAYLFDDADLELRDVTIDSPNRTLPTIGATSGRVVRVSGLSCVDFSSEQPGQVGRIEWGEGNLISGRRGPSRGSRGIRNKIRISQNPLLPSYQDSGIYHIDPRREMVDQADRLVRCYGVIVASLGGDSLTIPVRIHTNCFDDSDSISLVVGVLKLRASLSHGNAGGFAVVEKHFNFRHRAASTSSLNFPTTPIYTSGPSGQPNESLTMLIANPDQAGASQLSTGGDFWVGFDVLLSSGGRANPIHTLTYELDLMRG